MRYGKEMDKPWALLYFLAPSRRHSRDGKMPKRAATPRRPSVDNFPSFRNASTHRLKSPCPSRYGISQKPWIYRLQRREQSYLFFLLGCIWDWSIPIVQAWSENEQKVMIPIWRSKCNLDNSIEIAALSPFVEANEGSPFVLDISPYILH